MRVEQRMTDPYFGEIPWDMIYDDAGRLIGEVYKPLPVNERGTANGTHHGSDPNREDWRRRRGV